METVQFLKHILFDIPGDRQLPTTTTAAAATTMNHK
jgi:hypothetical protein